MFLITTLCMLLGMVAAAEGQDRELHLSPEVYQHRRGNQLKKSFPQFPQRKKFISCTGLLFCKITTLSHINLPYCSFASLMKSFVILAMLKVLILTVCNFPDTDSINSSS